MDKKKAEERKLAKEIPTITKWLVDNYGERHTEAYFIGWDSVDHMNAMQEYADYFHAKLSEELPSDYILGLSEPYPLKDVLITLRNATMYLLEKKDYDGHDYEEMGNCVKRANEIINRLQGGK